MRKRPFLSKKEISDQVLRKHFGNILRDLTVTPQEFWSPWGISCTVFAQLKKGQKTAIFFLRSLVFNVILRKHLYLLHFFPINLKNWKKSLMEILFLCLTSIRWVRKKQRERFVSIEGSHFACFFKRNKHIFRNGTVCSATEEWKIYFQKPETFIRGWLLQTVIILAFPWTFHLPIPVCLRAILTFTKALPAFV